MAPCKLLCQVPTWNLEFWATGFCPSKELPGHIESSWSWKFCDSRVCLEATRLVESARRQKRLWCFDVWKFLRKFHGDHFHTWQFPWCAVFFFKTFWRLKENWCAFIFLTDSGLGLDGIYVFLIRSHVFTMSRPQQLLEVHGHPTQQVMLSLRMWDTTSAKQKTAVL